MALKLFPSCCSTLVWAVCFNTPTAVQLDAWPAIQSGAHTLIAAPTGSGKTLAAFLTAIDSLVRQASTGWLEDKTASRLCVAAQSFVE